MKDISYFNDIEVAFNLSAYARTTTRYEECSAFKVDDSEKVSRVVAEMLAKEEKV